MRGDDGGEAGRAHELRQRAEHEIGRVRIEISGRFVGQQDTRRIGDRARDRDALLLAAREFRRTVRQPLLQSEIGQQLDRARRAPRACAGRFTICGSITFSSAVNSGSR